jgi:hypothetical protein
MMPGMCRSPLMTLRVLGGVLTLGAGLGGRGLLADECLGHPLIG